MNYGCCYDQELFTMKKLERNDEVIQASYVIPVVNLKKLVKCQEKGKFISFSI